MDTPRLFFRKNKSWGCSLHSQVRACARWSGELSATSTSMFSRLKSQSVRNMFHFRSNTKNLHTWIEKPDSDDYYVRDLHSHLPGATTSDDVLKKRIALKFHQLNLRVHEQNASTETQEEQDCVLRHDLSRRCMRTQSVRESTQPHAPAETSRLVDSDSSSVVNIVKGSSRTSMHKQSDAKLNAHKPHAVGPAEALDCRSQFGRRMPLHSVKIVHSQPPESSGPVKYGASSQMQASARGPCASSANAGEVIKDRIGCRSELIREKLADAEPDEPNAAMVPQDKHGALSSPSRKFSTGSVNKNFHLTIAPSTGRKITPHRGGAQIQTRVSPSFDRAFI